MKTLVAAFLFVAFGNGAQDAPFTLDSATLKAEETFTLKFPAPVVCAEGTKNWCCIVRADAPDSEYGSWAYVEAGATSAKLTAPKTSGGYEVRLHSDYPKKSSNVIHRVKVTVAGLSPTKPEDMKFTLAGASVAVDQKITAKFAAPMVAQQGEQFWVTLVEAGSPDDERGLWQIVSVGATEIVLPGGTASGKHEVRLHAGYPAKKHNIVHRVEIDVTGGPETAPTDPAKVTATTKESISFESKPVVEFNVPLRPHTGERFWIGLVAAGLPDSAYGLTAYPEPGAKTATLPVPISTGEHEIRVYANYPKKFANLIARLKFNVTGGPDFAPTDPPKVKMTLGAAKGAVGQAPKVTFDPPLRPKTSEQFWVTLVEADKPDTDWGQYKYLAVGAKEETLAPPAKTGKYEIRLHANYPTKSTNVVLRLTLVVE